MTEHEERRAEIARWASSRSVCAASSGHVDGLRCGKARKDQTVSKFESGGDRMGGKGEKREHTTKGEQKEKGRRRQEQ
jgi:hypothetical protein